MRALAPARRGGGRGGRPLAVSAPPPAVSGPLRGDGGAGAAGPGAAGARAGARAPGGGSPALGSRRCPRGGVPGAVLGGPAPSPASWLLIGWVRWNECWA